MAADSDLGKSYWARGIGCYPVVRRCSTRDAYLCFCFYSCEPHVPSSSLLATLLLVNVIPELSTIVSSTPFRIDLHGAGAL